MKTRTVHRKTQERGKMKYKFFIVPVLHAENAEWELNNFCSSHRIASVEKHFIEKGDKSCWALCISFLEPTGTKLSDKKSNIDYRDVLNEKDFTVFARLRELRKRLAEEEGLPAYALFTNEQLAQIVQNKINTLSGLKTIKGIGNARIEKYGAQFLSTLQNNAQNNEKP